MTDPGQEDKNGLGRAIGGAIGGAFDLAFGSVTSVGRMIGSAVGLRVEPGPDRYDAHRTPGALPGIDHLPEVHERPEAGAVTIQCVDYGPDRVETMTVDDLDGFLKQPKPAWASVRWVNVDGLHPYVLHRIQSAYGYHTLAAEDALHVTQRPRVEPYGSTLYIVARMFMLRDDRLTSEQVSMFLDRGRLVTFQEFHGDVWDRIRERLDTAGSRLREHDASFLVYALLDAIVDHCFPLLERYGDALEELEELVINDPRPHVLRQVHAVRRELVALRRVMWPMREVVSTLQQTEVLVSADARTYLRDVYEHNVQIIDIIETLRDMVSSLSDLYMSAVSNRMNEVMKVLTVISTIFIPITFLAGVYGMNFDHLPELHFKSGYYAFWVACGLITVGMVTFFWRRGWLGRD